MSGVGATQVLVAVVAVALAVNVLLPPLMTSLRRIGLRSVHEANPDAARPAGDEPTYKKLFDAFVALGFEPAGIETQVGWWISVWDWRKTFELRWLASIDGQTFVTITKIIPEEPWRFGAVTQLSDGSLVRTSCPGAPGLGDLIPEYRVSRLPGADPEELLARHREQVDAICRERGASRVSATMAEVATREALYGEALLNKMPHTHVQLFKIYFFMPALLIVSTSYLFTHELRLTILPWALGIPALLVRMLRDFIAMPRLRAAIVASHSDPRR